jgi:RNA polymerase sigma-70 factor (ECF subfamily)
MTSSATSPFPLGWLLRAQGGDPSATGKLLEQYRNYLHLLARTMVGAAMRSRVEPSDIVQETYLDAVRDFPQFRGGSERELMAWLRQILVRNVTDQVRGHLAHGRDVRREESLELMLERSSQSLHDVLAAGISSPSAQAARREQSLLVAEAMSRLPEDYRDVIIYRNLRGMKFEEVAAAMGRSSGAVRMLWARALEQLAAELGGVTL